MVCTYSVCLFAFQNSSSNMTLCMHTLTSHRKHYLLIQSNLANVPKSLPINTLYFKVLTIQIHISSPFFFFFFFFLCSSIHFHTYNTTFLSSSFSSAHWGASIHLSTHHTRTNSGIRRWATLLSHHVHLSGQSMGSLRVPMGHLCRSHPRPFARSSVLLLR